MSDFFSDDKPSKLIAFEIMEVGPRQLSKKELARLVYAFNKQWPGFGLLVQHYHSIDMCKQYRLHAVRTITTCESDFNKQLSREDANAFREFIKGFKACLDSLNDLAELAEKK